jgi:hypothetical protein
MRWSTGSFPESAHAAARHASSSSRLAPRLRPRFERLQSVVRAGLLALALLGLGEAAPAAFPVAVSVEAHGTELLVSVDGESHAITSGLGGGWRGVTFEQPSPLEREYQVDGSDTTATNDRPFQRVASLLDSPLYRFDAWLRDESSYSRWERIRVVDLTSGAALAPDTPLPSDFRVAADLRRPEAAARLWLDGATRDRREGLELDRDRRNARWVVQRAGATGALPRWFFPELPAPFAAELLHLLGRAAAAGYALVIVTLVIAGVVRRIPLNANVNQTAPGSVPENAEGAVNLGGRAPGSVRFEKFGPGVLPETSLFGRTARFGRVVTDSALACWLVAAALVTARLYHQLPHILDAVSYSFQARLFASGQLALAAPPIADAFKGPFEVIWQGRLFSQYPPGAPAVYALGDVLRLAWLIGPLASVVLIGATSWTAGVLFGPGCGLIVLALGVLSPFILFQAGSFLSHPIAAAFLAAALAAFVAAERGPDMRWFSLSGALLGAAFLSREAASVLFALPLGARLVLTRRWQSLSHVVVFGLPFVLVYLLYNQRLTGSPFLLPRSIFDPTDHFGFGDGIGFHQRHTLAAGLANTDELLTSLQFDLFGWPPLFALGLLGVPFLIGRSRIWDVLAAGGFLAFVIAYAGYFYHGIALGPRYYFEAMPWLLLLAGRGVQTLAQLARSRLAAVLVVGLLALNTLLFYLPSELQRRTDMSGLPGGAPLKLTFVQSSLLGPRLDGVPTPALVLTDDWWLFNTSLVTLNCPRIPECGVVFALASTQQTVNALRAQFPDRAVLHAVRVGDLVNLSY